MIIPNWLHQRTQVSPNRIALIASGERLTFRELSQRVDSLARKLSVLVLHRNHTKIGLFMRNSLDMALMIYAASRLGVILVPFNSRLTAHELETQLRQVKVSRFIYDDAAHPVIANVDKDLLFSSFTMSEVYALPEYDDAGVKFFNLEAFPTNSLNDSHSIIYTSGTTGNAKGAILTYGNHWWSAMASALNLGIHMDDVWLAVLPLFHVGGLAMLLRGVIYGNTVVIHESFDPAAVNRAIDEEQVSIISVVSTMLQRMLDQRGDRPYPPTLRCMLLGGGPAPQALLETCAARNIPVMQTYGMTETASQFVTLAPEDALRKLGSAGKPLMPNMLRIERDGELLPADEVGEIVVHGPTVTVGYIKNPQATAAAIRDGWLHTGDLGYVDDEGYLFVVSRRDDLIISGGENIYPAEVEAVLLSHPAIEEAAVIAAPDDRWGQVPIAVVKLRDHAQFLEDDLRAYCYERLARYKVPARFQVVESLPRNATGKILRRELANTWNKQSS